MIKTSPIASTQGTHKTLSAPRLPKSKTMLQKLKRKLVRESSEPQKPIRIKVKHLWPNSISFVVLVITSIEYELHQVDTTQDLIIHRIDDAILVEHEPLSNMENPEEIVDDDDDKMTNNDDHINHTLIKNEKTSRLETKNEKMQTPIPTPPRSFRNNLSLDKTTFVELMDNQDNISEVLCMSDLLGILKKIDDALHVSVQKISIDATNDHLKDSLPKIIS
nr:hypothetical protein [Tanacetum cinerariifolium]